ncbi:MAG: hypothetical protein KJ077_07720 [Anaerolineae bacterium]|nr:hypothetical protein [Anaerolineae bacterium]
MAQPTYLFERAFDLAFREGCRRWTAEKIRNLVKVMIWKYRIPHIWEADRTVWEDVYLLPDHPGYTAQALWLTIDALGFYEGSERDEAESRLGDQSYVIEGTNMLVWAEDFSKPELLKWVGIWLEANGLPVTALEEGTAQEFRGRTALDEALQTIYAEMKDNEGDKVHIHPDTFAEIPADTDTGHKYKIFFPRKLVEEIETMPEHEAEDLIRAITHLADNPTPAASKRLANEEDE